MLNKTSKKLFFPALTGFRAIAAWVIFIYHFFPFKNPNFIARLETEKMKTTFQSSATNSYHKYGIDFDVNYFNHLMNEAWLNGHFDAMQNFPKDFSIEYFKNSYINKNIFKIIITLCILSINML